MAEEKTLLPAGIPAGCILAFAGEKNRIPKGWLVCDGRVLKNTDYPKLYSAIGTVWGGSGTPDFYLPDLRGMFLRGVSEESNNDPDKELRKSPKEGGSNPGNNKNNVGSIQKDEIRSHNHGINPPNAFMNNDANSNSVEGRGNVNYGRSVITTTLTGGNETRPVNAYVFYIIKYEE